MKTSAELIWYQSEKWFHPNKHRAPEDANRSAIFISPPGACSSELLLTFKRLSDWRSWTPGHAVSNGLILCLHHGDISGLHMCVTEPPRWLEPSPQLQRQSPRWGKAFEAPEILSFCEAFGCHPRWLLNCLHSSKWVCALLHLGGMN